MVSFINELTDCSRISPEQRVQEVYNRRISVRIWAEAVNVSSTRRPDRLSSPSILSSSWYSNAAAYQALTLNLRFRLVSDIKRGWRCTSTIMPKSYFYNLSHFFALLTRLDEQQITHSRRQEIFQIISLKATEITVQNANTDSENYTKAGIKWKLGKKIS